MSGDAEETQMEEDQINEMIRRTLDASRRPPEPPLDAMWAQIEQRVFDVVPIRRSAGRVYARHWRAPALAAAAALVVGVGIGLRFAPDRTVTRFIAQPATVTRQSTAATQAARMPDTQLAASPERLHAQDAASPVDARVRIHNPVNADVAQLASQFTDASGGSDMSRYLTQTAALLASLPSDRAGAQSDTGVATQAAMLLTQTHLLLDSQAGSDPTLHRLLEDLELVLAQVARLRSSRNGPDLQLIHQALTSHDVLPRVHDAAVEASITD